MKKFQQFILVMITVISLLALSIYRNEYNKLRSTFEVLNIFSSPIQPKDCLTLNESVTKNNEEGQYFSNPLPNWVWIGEHYVYSAFWYSNSRNGFAKAIGVGPVHSDKKYECHVWYDHQDVIFSWNGKFGYSVNLRGNSSLAIYEFFCEVDDIDTKGKPYMFVFLYKSLNHTKKTFVPIFYQQQKKPGHFPNSTALCIKPDPIGFTKNEVIEFLSFHEMVGANHIIIYDNGIHHGILAKLKRLEGLKFFFTSMSILVWNFPYNELRIQEEVLKMDCFSRASDKVSAVGLLNWDSYLVPKSRIDILHMFQDHHMKQMTNFKVQCRLCCLNMKNNKRSDSSWPIILRKTDCLQINNFYEIILYPHYSDSASTKHLDVSSGFVNIYRNCNSTEKSRSEYDTTVFKFISGLMSNELLRLWKSAILFTSDV